MQTRTFSEKTYTLDILYHIGALENSIHFIFDHTSKTCAIIDPAWSADLFIQKIAEKGYTLTDIWLTHWHFDHTNAVDELVKKTGAKVKTGVNEAPYLQINSPYELVEDNQKIFLGDTQATVINTPGHSAGGICYLLDGHIIAGDTLFVYGAGHCSLAGGDIKTLFNSMQKLKTINDDIMLCCGHDYGCKIDTTMGEQKRGNAFLVIENQADFVAYVDGMQRGIIPYPTKATTQQEILQML